MKQNTTKPISARNVKRKARRFVDKKLNTTSAFVYYLRSPYFMDMISAINVLIEDIEEWPHEEVDLPYLKELWEKAKLPVMQQLMADAGTLHLHRFTHKVDRTTHMIICAYAFLVYAYLNETADEEFEHKLINLAMFRNWLSAFLQKYAIDFKERGIFELRSSVDIYNELFIKTEGDTETVPE